MMRAAAVVLAMAALALPAAAETRALVAGFDSYLDPVLPLAGAVNDADLIEAALRQAGVADLVRVPEAGATAQRLRAGLDGLLARAAAGDLVIFHFSGHGMKGPDLPPTGEEADGLDEYFLLPGYVDGAGSPEALRDDELYAYARSAAAKGVRVLFVLDTCHSGGLFRAADARLGLGASREHKAAKTLPPLVVKKVAPLRFGPNVAMISATTENEKVREMVLDGRMHGVLSHVFAAALGNAALDRDGDGAIASSELMTYVEQRVRSESGNAQDAQMIDPEGGMPLFGARAVAVEVKPPPAAPDAVRLLVRNGEVRDGAFKGVTLAAREEEADLVWDAAAGDVLSPRTGDVLAYGLDIQRLQPAIEAERAVRALAAMEAKGRPLNVFLEAQDDKPAGATRCAGDMLTILSGRTEFRHYTAVDITAEGVVQFIYPRPEAALNHEVQWSKPYPWRFRTRVTDDGPFGRDVVVVVASDAPLISLHAAFAAPEFELAPDAFMAELTRALEERRYDIGMTHLYTRRRPEDGPCAF